MKHQEKPPGKAVAAVIIAGMLVWGMWLCYAGIRARATGIPSGIKFEGGIPGEELFAGPCVIALALVGVYVYFFKKDR